jgi:lysozyme
VNALLAWLRSLLAAWRAGSASVDVPAAGGATAPPASPPQAGSVAPAVPEAPAVAAPRRINASGLALVKASEGLRLNAYQDSGGVWTVGYGHTRGVAPGSLISAQMAETLLLSDLATAERQVAAQLAADGWSDAAITDQEFSALVDFTFNLGGDSLPGRPSPLAQLLARGLAQVPEQLLRWDHAAGVELAGLKLRREREAQLWRTGSWT